MKTLKQEILQKMVQNYKTLSIKRQYFVRGKKQENGLFYDWNIRTKNASILEVQKVLNKTQMPFDFLSAVNFVKGKINRLVIDNGVDCIEVSYA